MARARQQRRDTAQSQRTLLIVGALIAILIAAGVIYYVQQESNQTFEIDNPRFSSYAGIPLDDSIDSNREIDEAGDIDEGVVRGVLEDGTPFIGNPNAPIVFAEFSDFSCPHCASFEPEVDQLIDQYVRTGQLRLEYRPLTFVGGEFSITAARGAICAAEQGAFWEFHKELFRLQGTQGADYFTSANMETLADDLGLDGEELRSCMNSNRPDRTLRAAEQLRAEYDVNSTPTVIYRANDAETWNRFFDPNGEPVSRVSYAELGNLIGEFNTGS
jgi:protein-disulfide isomerase